jgi:hypothetical protein
MLFLNFRNDFSIFEKNLLDRDCEFAIENQVFFMAIVTSCGKRLTLTLWIIIFYLPLIL